jgi:hypothetical protein
MALRGNGIADKLYGCGCLRREFAGGGQTLTGMALQPRILSEMYLYLKRGAGRSPWLGIWTGSRHGPQAVMTAGLGSVQHNSNRTCFRSHVRILLDRRV